jgi:DNA-binding transcriptional regulator YhcF (GntR family)
MKISLQPGEAFNPYRMFTGLFIPEVLARSDRISAGAKLAWGRLARYAGENGQCYPSVKTLASEIGVGERQTQKYLVELEKAKLIRRRSCFADRAQTSNTFEFLWHEMFQEGVNDSSGEGVNYSSPRGVNDHSPKESHIEENHTEESQEYRLRLSAHELQKSQFATGSSSPRCKQYPQLREALADYMQNGPNEERIYPSDRHVVEIMDTAMGANEVEVVECLRYLREERGLLPGTRNGPRHFSWFPTVVSDYFSKKHQRSQVANPSNNSYRAGGVQNGLSKAVFDPTIEAIWRDDRRERA